MALFSPLPFYGWPCLEALLWLLLDYTINFTKQIAQPRGELMSVCEVVCDHWIKCICTGVKCLEKDNYSQHLLCCQKPLLTGQQMSPCPHSLGCSPQHMLHCSWTCKRMFFSHYVHYCKEKYEWSIQAHSITLGSTGKCRTVTFNLHSEDLSSFYSSTMQRCYSPSYSRSAESGSSPLSGRTEFYPPAPWGVCSEQILHLQVTTLIARHLAAQGSSHLCSPVWSCANVQRKRTCSWCLHHTGLGAHPAGVQCGLLLLFPLFLP